MVLSNFMTEPADQYKDVAHAKLSSCEEQEAQMDDDRVILILDVSSAFFHFEDQKSSVHRELQGEGQDRRRSSGEDDVWPARRKRRVGRLLLLRVRGRKRESWIVQSFVSFSQEEKKVKAWVYGHDVCLEGLGGKARSLESMLEERMISKRSAELRWAKADDKNISLLNRLD